MKVGAGDHIVISLLEWRWVKVKNLEVVMILNVNKLLGGGNEWIWLRSARSMCVRNSIHIIVQWFLS